MPRKDFLEEHWTITGLKYAPVCRYTPCVIKALKTAPNDLLPNVFTSFECLAQGQYFRYMSKMTRTQNLGVSRWRNPKPTIGPEPYIHPPLPYGGKFWVAQPRHP